MSSTYERKDIKQVFADQSGQIRRLQTGGRPIIGMSQVVRLGAYTLNPGEGAVLQAILEWPAAAVEAMMGAVPYFRIRVDADDNGSLWPTSGFLSGGQRNLQLSWVMDLQYLIDNPNKAKMSSFLKNNDGSQHTYFVDVAFTYVAGASSSQ